MISDLTVIIEGSFSFSEKLVFIFETCQEYFINYPDLKALIYAGDIEGFGVLGSYIDMCNVYWRVDNFEYALGGPVSNCEFFGD